LIYSVFREVKVRSRLSASGKVRSSSRVYIERAGEGSQVGTELSSELLVHLRVDTSYNRFCQFYNASSESDEQALSLRQLKLPSAVGLM